MSDLMWIIIVVAFLFMIFSMIGWVIELFFRRFVSLKKWINPGLLKGPYLPIYGMGVSCLYIFVNIMSNFKDRFSREWLFDAVIIVGIGILMTVIELIGGLIFICGMKVRLWDYSGRWGNYKGIICPLFSFLWTLAGALFYFVLFDPLNELVYRFVTLDWFIFAVMMMGVFYGIFIVDFCYSVQLIKKIRALAKEMRMEIDWDHLKVEIREDLKKRKVKTSFLSPFNTPFGLSSHVKSHNIGGVKGRMKRTK